MNLACRPLGEMTHSFDNNKDHKIDTEADDAEGERKDGEMIVRQLVEVLFFQIHFKRC